MEKDSDYEKTIFVLRQNLKSCKENIKKIVEITEIWCYNGKVE